MFPMLPYCITFESVVCMLASRFRSRSTCPCVGKRAFLCVDVVEKSVPLLSIVASFKRAGFGNKICSIRQVHHYHYHHHQHQQQRYEHAYIWIESHIATYACVCVARIRTECYNKNICFSVLFGCCVRDKEGCFVWWWAYSLSLQAKPIGVNGIWWMWCDTATSADVSFFHVFVFRNSNVYVYYESLYVYRVLDGHVKYAWTYQHCVLRTLSSETYAGNTIRWLPFRSHASIQCSRCHINVSALSLYWLAIVCFRYLNLYAVFIYNILHMYLWSIYTQFPLRLRTHTIYVNVVVAVAVSPYDCVVSLTMYVRLCHFCALVSLGLIITKRHQRCHAMRFHRSIQSNSNCENWPQWCLTNAFKDQHTHSQKNGTQNERKWERSDEQFT